MVNLFHHFDNILLRQSNPPLSECAFGPYYLFFGPSKIPLIEVFSFSLFSRDGQGWEQRKDQHCSAGYLSIL